MIRSVGGRDVPVECDTVLVHGDTPGAVSLARLIRKELLAAGVSIAAPAGMLDAPSEARPGALGTGA
jgi:UPF0271 protein